MTDATKKLQDNEIILFGQVHALDPLKGREARLMMPRVLAFGTQVFQSLILGEFDVLGLYERISTVEKAMDVLSDILAVVQHLIITLQGKWEEFDRDLLPFLLQVPPEALEDEGEPAEVYLALVRAVRWYAAKSITPEQKEAFKTVMENMLKNAKPRGSKA